MRSGRSSWLPDLALTDRSAARSDCGELLTVPSRQFSVLLGTGKDHLEVNVAGGEFGGPSLGAPCPSHFGTAEGHRAGGDAADPSPARRFPTDPARRGQHSTL